MVSRGRGRVISRFGGRVVRLGLWVDWSAFIFDIGNKTVVVISSVGHSLDTAIRKSNLVRSRNGFAISSLLSVEFSSRVVIGYSIFKCVGFWGFVIYWGFTICWSRMNRSGVVWRWRSCWEGSSTSYKGTHNSKSEHVE